MNNGETIDFTNVRMFSDGKEIGTFEAITAEVKLEDENKGNTNSINFSKSYSGTLKVAHIDTDNPIFKYTRLVARINYYTDVVYYARHSKKKHVAIQKLNKLIDEYNHLKEEN